MQGGPVSLAYGPDGALYYTTYSSGGQVRRIAFVNNKAPVADLKTTPSDPDTGKTFDPAPLAVNFDASGTNDPENDVLTHRWDFDGDGTEDETTTMSAIRYKYDTVGAYTAALMVEDSKGNTDVAKVPVYAGNTAPPQPVIEAPASGDTFEVDEQITLSVSATDADGQDINLKWEVIRHHTAPNEHTLPRYSAPTTTPATAQRSPPLALRTCALRTRRATTWRSGLQPPTRRGFPRPLAEI